MVKALKAQIIKTASTNSAEAVLQLYNQITIQDVAGLLFFCSSSYDLDDLSTAINQQFDFPVYGCTTAGEISDTMSFDSIVALVLNADSFVVHSRMVRDLENFKLSDAMKIKNDIENSLSFSDRYILSQNFGFLFIDGLSRKEEKITSLFYQAFGGINILGGSIADDYNMKQTHIFYSSQFHTNAAMLSLIEIKDSFGIFKMQNFIPTQKELITTQVEFNNRIVNEINGIPAAIAYAEINNLDAHNLTKLDLAMHPLMINVANQWYIRSISNVRSDLSLQFHCAIDYGLPVTIGKSVDMVQLFEEEVKQILSAFDEIYFTLGCDCIFRKIEIIDKKYKKNIETLLKKIKFVGFNSYGEQYNGIHFNQTMIGITVGKAK